MKKILVVLIAACTTMSVAYASSLPSYYPTNGFHIMGVIDILLAEEGRMVVDDMSFHLADKIIVHSLSAEFDSFSRLREGRKVGFNLDSEVITEIWLLPSTYDESDYHD